MKTGNEIKEPNFPIDELITDNLIGDCPRCNSSTSIKWKKYNHTLKRFCTNPKCEHNKYPILFRKFRIYEYESDKTRYYQIQVKINGFWIKFHMTKWYKANKSNFDQDDRIRNRLYVSYEDVLRRIEIIKEKMLQDSKWSTIIIKKEDYHYI